MRIVLCTCPHDSADSVAETVLKDRLAACVNIISGIRSKYWWKGDLCADDESLLIMKTRANLVEELMARVKAVHPHQVAEIIAFEIKEGNPDYLNWIASETR